MRLFTFQMMLIRPCSVMGHVTVSCAKRGGAQSSRLPSTTVILMNLHNVANALSLRMGEGTMVTTRYGRQGWVY